VDGVITEALLLDEQLVLSLGTRQLPPPLAGEALVRVAWAGVCGSDLHVLRTGEWVAYWPATLGHEVVGVVQECPGGEVAPGTVVVVDSRIPCRRCAGCQKAVSLCENISWLGEAMPGGFARHLVVPVTSLVRCPPQIEPAVAVLAEPLAVAMHAVSSLMRRPDDVLVLGYGPVGALVHLELARRWPGLAISVSEILGPRRQLAMALGARLAPLAPGDERASTARFSLVVDTAGYPQSLSDACTLAGNGGTVLVVALSFDPVMVAPAELVERNLTISGSVGFDDELEEALSVLTSDPDRYRPLVTEAVLLEEAAERLAALRDEPSAGKVVVHPWPE
jgi:threonine dehydrogenase-like Zn-dependent dehydrogenase